MFMTSGQAVAFKNDTNSMSDKTDKLDFIEIKNSCAEKECQHENEKAIHRIGEYIC